MFCKTAKMTADGGGQGFYGIILVLSGIEDHGGAWIEARAVDNPRQGSGESLSFALGR